MFPRPMADPTAARINPAWLPQSSLSPDFRLANSCKSPFFKSPSHLIRRIMDRMTLSLMKAAPNLM